MRICLNLDDMHFPEWLKKRVCTGGQIEAVEALLRDLNLHTVCESARCPNRLDCFSQGTATFMILGDVCTRNCRFCAVESGVPLPPDPEEPRRVAQAVQRLGLRHAVITSVTRDDLQDGGADQFVQTVQQIRSLTPETAIELLVPDFQGTEQPLRAVVEAGPDIIGHNLETVPSLYRYVRPQAGYARSLSLLRSIKFLNAQIYTKSGLMLGLGESREEVLTTLRDLRRVSCDVVTLGQYLQPSKLHAQVKEFIPPEEFEEYEKVGKALGFLWVVAGPFVRSSYRAGGFWDKVRRLS